MKKVLFALALCLSTTFMFSFKSSTTASQAATDITNYQIEEKMVQDWVDFYKAYQETGDEKILGHIWKAVKQFAKDVWNGSCRDVAVAAVVALLKGNHLQMTDADCEQAAEIGLISRL